MGCHLKSMAVNPQKFLAHEPKENVHEVPFVMVQPQIVSAVYVHVYFGPFQCQLS